MSVVWKCRCRVLCSRSLVCCIRTPPPIPSRGIVRQRHSSWSVGRSETVTLFSPPTWTWIQHFYHFAVRISENKKRGSIYLFIYLFCPSSSSSSEWIPEQERNTSECLAVSKCASSALPLARVAYNHPNNMQQDLADMKLFCSRETMTNTMAWPCETAVEEERWSAIRSRWIQFLLRLIGLPFIRVNCKNVRSKAVGCVIRSFLCSCGNSPALKWLRQDWFHEWKVQRLAKTSLISVNSQNIINSFILWTA